MATILMTQDEKIKSTMTIPFMITKIGELLKNSPPILLLIIVCN
jgi:hypothetical protein